MSRNAALARRQYEVWNTGGLEASMEQIWAPDIVYHESPEQPDTGVFHGVEAMADHLRELMASGRFRHEVLSVDARGDWTLTALEIDLEGASSGLRTAARVFHVSRWKDGRVQELRSFFDGDQARREYDELSAT